MSNTITQKDIDLIPLKETGKEEYTYDELKVIYQALLAFQLSGSYAKAWAALLEKTERKINHNIGLDKSRK